jgi:hypothetical protein
MARHDLIRAAETESTQEKTMSETTVALYEESLKVDLMELIRQTVENTASDSLVLAGWGCRRWDQIQFFHRSPFCSNRVDRT